MGEEWSASTPFLFFVDFSDDEALSNAVREGRRREFAHFKSFSEQHGDRQIPDPTSAETFNLSALKWEEASASPHADVRSDVKHLLRLRRDEVVPLTKSAFQGANRERPQPDCLTVT